MSSAYLIFDFYLIVHFFRTVFLEENKAIK